MNVVRCARWAVLAFALLTSGCAATWRTWVEDPVYTAASEYTYARPIEEVWPEVVSFMKRRGYPGQVDNASHRFVSIWQEEQTGRMTQTWRRYYVEGLRLNPANCRIRIFQNDMYTGKSTGQGQGLGADGLRPVSSIPSDMGDSNAAHTLVRSLQRARQLEFELLQVLEPQEAQALYAKHKRKGLF